MRGDLRPSMMPVAPAAIHNDKPSTKPKLGFSIESIVGLSTPPNDSTTKRADDSEGEVAPLTPPPAHTTHQKSSPTYYRSDEIYGSYGNFHQHQQQQQQRVMQPQHRTHHEFVSPIAAYHPSVMSHHYGAGLSLGHCHPGQYPLASYLVNRDYGSYPSWLMARQPRILPYRPQGKSGFFDHLEMS